MKKVIITINYIKDGGLEKVLIDTINAMYQYCDITIIVIYNIIDPIYYKEISTKAKIIVIDKYRDQLKNKLILSLYSRLYDKKYIQRFLYKRELKKHLSNIEIAFSEEPALTLVSQSSHPHKIAWIHTDFLEDPYFLKKHSQYSYKKILSKFKTIVFVSKSLEEKFIKTYAITNTKVIYNSIDFNRINRLAQKTHDLQINNNKINFISIGRLSFEKGFDRLINSFSLLSEEKRKKCHLTIIGNGYEYSNLTNQINQFNLSETITLIGRQTNPYNLLKGSDILLSPSRYEGFGLVILEALALEKPVIATNTIGANELLESGKYGIILENKDNAFDSIISNIIENCNLLNQYKGKLKERAQEYSFENFKKEILNLILQ